MLDLKDLDPLLAALEGIHKPQAPMTRYANEIWHAGLDEKLGNDLAAGQLLSDHATEFNGPGGRIRDGFECRDFRHGFTRINTVF